MSFECGEEKTKCPFVKKKKDGSKEPVQTGICHVNFFSG